MSFATLSATLEECSAISKLELTKNPFDGELDGRLNLPALSSPTIFTKQDTPASQKRKGFRWSIDEISKLNPADIDEFPHQEYSSTYDRPEDETRAQEAINEYFSRDTILPSPWTPENQVKHVTFSPLPPSTAYISGDESMTDASHSSPCNTSGRRQLLDASSQTSLTFPPSFDLSKIVDSGFYSYVEDEGSVTGRDLNVSSLRRKLFIQDDGVSPMKPGSVEQLSKQTRSILKSPSPINLLTSSPFKDRFQLHPDLDSPFSSSSKTSQSPGISPIKPAASRDHKASEGSGLQLDGTLSNDDVFAGSILESSNVCINPSLLPDVSPIKKPNVHNLQCADDGASEDNVVERDTPERDGNLNDGGPMKISELSHVEMEYENEDENNHSEMDVSELEPVIAANTNTHNAVPAESKAKFGASYDVNSQNSNDITGDVIVRKNGDNIGREHQEVCYMGDKELYDTSRNNVILKSDDDVMSKNVNDDIYKNTNDVTQPKDGLISLATVGPPNSSNKLTDEGKSCDLAGWKPTGRDYVDREGNLKQDWVTEDDEGSEKENMVRNVYMKYDAVPCHSHSIDNGDEELMKRASAAIRRADRVVQETWMQQGKIHRKTGTSSGILNWSRVDGVSLWHPIDMSTPLVNEKLKNKPLALQTVDASTRKHGPVSDLDSYNNLLSTLANSRLDQGLRSYCPAKHDSGLATLSSENSSNRAPNTGLESRARRCLSDLKISSSQNLPQDVYLSSRHGKIGTSGKRYSWPLWKPLRGPYRYLSGRTISPPISSIQPHSQLRAVEDKLKNRHSSEHKRRSKSSDRYNKKYDDYFDGIHSNWKSYYR